LTARKFWGLAATALATISFSAAVADSAAAANSTTSIYHPAKGSRAFGSNDGGWKGSKESGGSCAVDSLCPTVTNSYQGTGGADGNGDGYLRSAFGPLLGVGGERSAIWRSPVFAYKGAEGQFPDVVSFDLDRRADVDALVSTSGNDADFTAKLVDQKTGKGISLTGPTPLANATDWSSIKTETVDPEKLVIGHPYFIRISSRIQFGADVFPDSTADYDNVVLEATQSIDTTPCSTPIDGTGGPDDLTGTDGGDKMRGLKGGDKIASLRGDDCLQGGPGADTVSGSGGSDSLRGNEAADTLRGGPGQDTISGGSGADKIRGVDGSDALKGGSDVDNITGAKGRDVIRGAGGDDVLKGGSDPDKVSGGAGRDDIRGLADDDKLVGAGGKDEIRGGGGRDKINAGSGRDKVSGGGGRDTIKVRGNGTDKAKCGGGRDTVFADHKDRVGKSCERVQYRD